MTDPYEAAAKALGRWFEDTPEGRTFAIEGSRLVIDAFLAASPDLYRLLDTKERFAKVAVDDLYVMSPTDITGMYDKGDGTVQPFILQPVRVGEETK